MEKDLPRDVVKIALKVLEGLGSSRALTVAILLRYKEWDQIATLRCDPRIYPEGAHDSYFADASATALLRKLADLPTTIDRRKKAIEKWWEGERSCFRTNRRLSQYEWGLPLDPRDDRIASFLVAMRKNIFAIVGHGPDDSSVGRFGPGATFADRGQYTTVPDKMNARPTLTPAASPYLSILMENMWGRIISAEKDPLLVRGNRFATAPKDATTDRAIGSEPSINIFYQLGLGQQFREKLRLAGLDLKHGQDIHRRIACVASLTGSFATLDLSNASDSICTTLVRLCMPLGWLERLNALRSPFSLIDGKWVRLEKFSSMGNGYTFELETLIFAAISKTALELAGFPSQLGSDVYVYGDDIIVPTDGVHEVISALKFFGFQLNLEKSFWEGPFRESCGGDYFCGQPVRPYHLKELPNEPQQLIALANGIRRVIDSNRNISRKVRLRGAWFSVLDALPTAIRCCYGPKDLGDIVVHSEERWNVRYRSGVRYVKCYRPATHRKVAYSLFSPDIVLACAVYGLGWNDGGVIPRDAVSGYKIGWVPYQKWGIS